jgi:hypothetical protein
MYLPKVRDHCTGLNVKFRKTALTAGKTFTVISAYLVDATNLTVGIINRKTR